MFVPEECTGSTIQAGHVRANAGHYKEFMPIRYFCCRAQNAEERFRNGCEGGGRSKAGVNRTEENLCQMLEMPVEQKTNSVAWVRERTIPTELLLLSVKLVPTFADRGCHVVSVTYPYGRILGFLDRSRYYFFQAAPQLFQTYFSQDLVMPGIKPESLDL
jgi:hypothetical protein